MQKVWQAHWAPFFLSNLSFTYRVRPHTFVILKVRIWLRCCVRSSILIYYLLSFRLYELVPIMCLVCSSSSDFPTSMSFFAFWPLFFHACGLSFFSSRNAHVRREDYSAIGNVVVESSSSNTTKDPIHLFLFPGFTGDSPKHLHSLPMEKKISTLLSTQMCKNPNGYKCCLLRRKKT